MDVFNVDALLYWGWRGARRKGEGETSGLRVRTSIDTECLVPPICFLLSQGAGEELQLPWGHCQ